MKNRIVWFAAVLAFLSLVLSGCSGSPNAETSATQATTPTSKQETDTRNGETVATSGTVPNEGVTVANTGSAPKSAILEKVNNDLPCEQLIKKRYKAEHVAYIRPTFLYFDEAVKSTVSFIIFHLGLFCQ